MQQYFKKLLTMGDNVWTTETDGKHNGSRAPTAVTNDSMNNIIKNSYFVGIQSKFKRKYYHKSIFMVLLAIIVFLLIGLIVIACYLSFPPKVCDSHECLRASANLLQSMDRSIDPCTDFYKFTCGNWQEEHPRPDSSSSHDWFAEKQTKVLRKIREFLQKNSTGDEPLPVQQTRLMYRACMNLGQMNALNYTVIFDLLKQFNLPLIPSYFNYTEPDNKQPVFDWIETIVKIKMTTGSDVLIGFDIFPDPTNRSVNRVVLGSPDQSSELPFKDHLDDRLKKIIRKHVAAAESDDTKVEEEIELDAEDIALLAYSLYIKEVMTALFKASNTTTVSLEEKGEEILEGAAMTVAFAKNILKAIEKAENASKATETLEDLENYTVTEMQAKIDTTVAPLTPIPIFSKYLTLVFAGFKDVQFNQTTEKVLTSKSDMLYLVSLTEILANMTAARIELFIWWSVVEDLILHTTNDMRKLYYEYAVQMTSIEGGTSRSIYCSNGVNKMLGMAVSYAIVDNNFLNVTRPRVENMLSDIRVSFNRLVRDTTWMDWETKEKTLEKSMNMKSLIGFPDWLMNTTSIEEFYGGIKINETTHLMNMLKILKWRMRKKVSEWRKPNEFGWATTPTNVNAFHTFQANAITIPLAILQYPFYHLGLEALNYGAIGTILGHELTHGFDDSGRQFDKNGNMRQWWTNATIKEYVNRTTCFVNQYGGYKIPEINQKVNGELTLGENIADNGGLREAYHAYQLYKKKFDKEPLLPGFENYTHDQLFFISFGNLWCESLTAAAAKWSLEDSHCPGRIRLKGVLTNSQEFSSTFNCPRGSGMFPQDQQRCRIW